MLPTPYPCPFCGVDPRVRPEDPLTEGNAWGEVRCYNPTCPARPAVTDGELVNDERGSDAYKAAAITRWNTAIYHNRPNLEPA